MSTRSGSSRSITDSIPVAAAIQQEQNPIPPIERFCSVCDEKLPAGYVRHPQCRGFTVP